MANTKPALEIDNKKAFGGILAIDDGDEEEVLFDSNQLEAAALNDTVDVVKFMKEGSSLLKYGRRGYPHFRFFQIDPSSTFLLWYSSKNSLEKTQIKLCQIKEFIEGQTTSIFNRIPNPNLINCSFSIKYDDSGEEKTLDLIAKDKYEYDLWKNGIFAIIKYFQKGGSKVLNTTGDIFRTKSYTVKIPPLNDTAIVRNLSKQPPTPASILEKEFKSANDRYNKVSKIFSQSQIKDDDFKQKIEKKLKQIKEEIGKIETEISKKERNALKRRIWLTSVELKVTNDMIIATSKE